MLVLCLGVMAGYLLGGLVTARAVFRQERERFLRAGGARTATDAADGGLVRRFERQERQQTEAFALCAGALWPVALPLLALHGLFGAVALDRGRTGVAARPDPAAVAARIDELERELRLDAPAFPLPSPAPPSGGFRRTERTEQPAGAARARPRGSD